MTTLDDEPMLEASVATTREGRRVVLSAWGRSEADRGEPGAFVRLRAADGDVVLSSAQARALAVRLGQVAAWAEQNEEH